MDLEQTYDGIHAIKVYNRLDSPEIAAFRLDGFYLKIYDENDSEVWTDTNPPGAPPPETIVSVPYVSGRKVRLDIATYEFLNFGEVMVMVGVPK